MAVRVKQATSLDMCVISAYFAPSSRESHNIYVKLLKWVDKVISALPSRTVLVLLCDANVRIGRAQVADHADIVGPEEAADSSSYHTGLFVQLLAQHGLAPLNTWPESVPHTTPPRASLLLVLIRFVLHAICWQDLFGGHTSLRD